MNYYSKLFLVLCFTLLFNGCSALQKASYHKPSLSNPEINTDKFANGIIFKTGNLCLGVRESFRNGDYNPLFIGPLFFTVFPLGILSPGSLPPSPDFWLEMEILTDQKGIVFYPTKIEIEFDDGTKTNAFKVLVDKTSWKLTKNIQEPIPISYFHEFEFKFRKPTIDSTVKNLIISGIKQADKWIPIPHVNFSQTTELRLITPGKQASNTYPGDSPQYKCIDLMWPANE